MAQNIIQFNYSLNNTYTHLENALLSKQLLKDDYVNYRYLFIASLSYVDEPLIVKNITTSKRVNVLIDSYFTFHFGVGFHLRKDMLLGVQSGFTKASLNGFDIRNFNLTGTTEEDSSLTDSKILFKWRITDPERNYALAIIPQLTLPTGSERSFTTDGSVGFGLELAFETILSNTVQVVANLGYHHSSDAYYSPTNTYIALDYRDKVVAALGAYIPFNDDFGANIEFTFHYMLSSNVEQNPNELYGGLRWQAARPLGVFLGAAVGNLESGNDSNDFKLIGGLKFHGGSLEEGQQRIVARVDAVDDMAIASPGQPQIIDVLSNDLIPDNRMGHLRIVSNSHPEQTACSVVKSPLAVEYRQLSRFYGTSICRYEYCSAEGICDEADLRITVHPPQKKRVVQAEPYGNLVWNKSIYFCNDCDWLNARSIEVTKELRNYIQKKRGRISKIVIEGHTSLVASKAYNLALSKRRARNTYNQLIKLGVPANMMIMVAYGKSRPELKSFDGKRKHPTNRRVEFRIYEK